MIAFQATCVVINKRGLLIVGPPGSGKTSLALDLIDRGAELIGDDSVMITEKKSRLIAHPHPETRGLLEIRNLGLITYPVCESASLSLMIRLDEEAERYVVGSEYVELAGSAIPMLRLWPKSPVLSLKAEIALKLYGLP